MKPEYNDNCCCLHFSQPKGVRVTPGQQWVVSTVGLSFQKPHRDCGWTSSASYYKQLRRIQAKMCQQCGRGECPDSCYSHFSGFFFRAIIFLVLKYGFFSPALDRTALSVIERTVPQKHDHLACKSTEMLPILQATQVQKPACSKEYQEISPTISQTVHESCMQ